MPTIKLLYPIGPTPDKSGGETVTPDEYYVMDNPANQSLADVFLLQYVAEVKELSARISAEADAGYKMLEHHKSETDRQTKIITGLRKESTALKASTRLLEAGWKRTHIDDTRADWQVDWTDPETGTVMGFYAAKNIQISRELGNV